MISNSLINLVLAVVLLAAAMVELWQAYMHFKEAHLGIVNLIIISLFLRYAVIYQIYLGPIKYNQIKGIAIGPYLLNP